MSQVPVHFGLILRPPATFFFRRLSRVAFLGALLLAATFPAGGRAAITGGSDGGSPSHPGPGRSGAKNGSTGRRQMYLRPRRRLVKE
jgi:hypothetical protein